MAISIKQNYGENNNPANSPYSGPLASLYENRYTYDALRYPRDLGSDYRGHIVKFDIYDVKPLDIKEVQNLATKYVVNPAEKAWEKAGKIYDESIAIAKEAISDPAGTAQRVKDQALSGAKNVYDAATGAFGDVTGRLSDFGQKISEATGGKLQIEPRNESISKSISLYMPDSVNFSYNSSYGNLSLAEAAGSIPLVGKIAQAVTGGIGQGGNPLLRLGLNAAGYVFNPQQQLMFEGIDFRTYQMSFTFTPYSAQESENIKKIIKTFREYAAPTIVGAAAGFFFNPPGMFDVSFLFNGKTNENLNKIKKSVIESIDVNYTPNGWAAHENGAPVQTTLTMSFKEMFLVDRIQIRDGY